MTTLEFDDMYSPPGEIHNTTDLYTHLYKTDLNLEIGVYGKCVCVSFFCRGLTKQKTAICKI